MNPLDSQHRSQISSQLKRSILWNVVQPGDPYDIRKSMIARLPGDKRPQMGANIQLICLLQAAEIQRLSTCLDQYQHRMTEVQKIQLDRHSYEVQIKQLCGKSQQEEALKSQIYKLKQFIGKLTSELEQTRHKVASPQITQKYQRALSEINRLTSQKNNMELKMNQFSSEYTLLENQYLEEKGRNDDYFNRFTIISQEIDRLNFVIKQKIGLERDLQGRLGNLKGENDYLTQTNQQLANDIQYCHQHHTNIDDYQSKFQAISKQIQRLNSVLQHKITQNKQLSMQLQQYHAIQDQLNSERRKVGEYEGQLNHNQHTLAKLKQSNSQLIAQLEQLRSIQSHIGELQHRLQQESIHRQQLNSQNTSLRGQIHQIKKQHQVLRRQYHLMEQNYHQKEENEKINLQNRSRQIRDMEALQMQKKNQQQKIIMLKEKIRELQEKIEYLQNQNQQHAAYWQQIVQQSHTKIEGYENKFAMLSQQIQRLNSNLQFKVQQQKPIQLQVGVLMEQNQQLKSQVADINAHYQKILNELAQKHSSEMAMKDRQISNQTSTYESNTSEHLSEIHRLNQVLKQKIDEFTVIERQLHEYKNTRSSYANREKELVNDIQRLNNLLRLKVEEATKWENSSKKYNLRADQIFAETQSLKKQIQSLYQKHQIEINRVKTQEVQVYKTESISYKREIEKSRLEVEHLRKQNKQIRSNNKIMSDQREKQHEQLLEYQEKINMIFQQIDRLQNILENYKKQNSQLKANSQQNSQLHEKNHKLLQQIDRLNQVTNLQSIELKELRLLLTDDYALDRRLKEQLSLMVVLFAEIETLRMRVEDKEKEVEQVRRSSLLPLRA